MLLRFSRIGVDTSRFHALADAEFMLATIAHYETRLPSTAVLSDLASARTLKALSFRRNKVIAHNEDTSALSFPHTTWGEARLLVDLAKNFVDVIGAGVSRIFFPVTTEFSYPLKMRKDRQRIWKEYLRRYSRAAN